MSKITSLVVRCQSSLVRRVFAGIISFPAWAGQMSAFGVGVRRLDAVGLVRVGRSRCLMESGEHFSSHKV